MEVDYCVCFQLGKAIRQGDPEGFFDIYDSLPIPVKDETRHDHVPPLEVIKEFARQISGLSLEDYELVERASLEKKLPPSQTFDSELLRNSYTYTCTELVSSLLKKLHRDAHSGTSDSGVYSDDSYVKNEVPNAHQNRKLSSPTRSPTGHISNEPLAYPANGRAREPVRQPEAPGHAKGDANEPEHASSCLHLYPRATTRQQQLSSPSKASVVACHAKSRKKKVTRQTLGPQQIFDNKHFSQTKQSSIPQYRVPPPPEGSASWHSNRQRTLSPKQFPQEIHNKHPCRVRSAVDGHRHSSQWGDPSPQHGCCESTALNQMETSRNAKNRSASNETTSVVQQGSTSFNHREAAEFLQQG